MDYFHNYLLFIGFTLVVGLLVGIVIVFVEINDTLKSIKRNNKKMKNLLYRLLEEREVKEDGEE